MHQRAGFQDHLRLVLQHGLGLQPVHPKPADDYGGGADPKVVVCLEDVQVAAGASMADYQLILAWGSD